MCSVALEVEFLSYNTRSIHNNEIISLRYSHLISDCPDILASELTELSLPEATVEHRMRQINDYWQLEIMKEAAKLMHEVAKSIDLKGDFRILKNFYRTVCVKLYRIYIFIKILE